MRGMAVSARFERVGATVPRGSRWGRLTATLSGVGRLVAIDRRAGTELAASIEGNSDFSLVGGNGGGSDTRGIELSVSERGSAPSSVRMKSAM